MRKHRKNILIGQMCQEMVFAREQDITFARDSPDSMSRSMIYLAWHINLNLYKSNKFASPRVNSDQLLHLFLQL